MASKKKPAAKTGAPKTSKNNKVAPKAKAKAKVKAKPPVTASGKKGAAKTAAPKKSALKKSALKKNEPQKTPAGKKAAPVSKAKAKPTVAKASTASSKVPAKAAAPKANAAKTASSKGGASKFDRAFRPLDDRVLVEPQGKSERTAGGLFIPDTVQERPHQGRVLAVGPGARNKKGTLRPLDVKPGENVLYGPHSGVDLEFEGRTLLLLKEHEILGVVR